MTKPPGVLSFHWQIEFCHYFFSVSVSSSIFDLTMGFSRKVDVGTGFLLFIHKLK